MAVKRARRPQQIIYSVAGYFAGRLTHYLMPAKPNQRSAADMLTLSTGLRTLDKAIGLNGLPRGYLTELISPNATADSSGTFCIAARLAAKAQRHQELVTIIDLSHNFDAWLAERAGLVAPELLLTQPETVFDALTALEEAARQAGFVVVILGFVSELLDHVQPHLLKVLLRRLRTIVKQSESVFLFVTTPAEDNPFSPTNYPDGFYLADLADVRLWVQEERWTYRDSVATAYKANLTVIKNQLGPAGAGADIRIKFVGV